MKRKGVIVTVFFGFILLSSTIFIAFPGVDPEEPNSEENDPEITITGTPADTYPDAERAQFCGSNDPKSTNYVQEYSIPTLCTNPLAIITDNDGNVWFAQTNTGNLAKFDPMDESFIEYENPIWPENGSSMMWGIDYAPDGHIWFTDDTYDSIWKFSVENENYDRLAYPSDDNSLPQKLQIDGSQIVVNDFYGNKITFVDLFQSGAEINYLSVPSPIDNSFTSDFAIDQNDSVWYTNWIFGQGGVLVKFDQTGYVNSVSNSEDKLLPLLDFIQIYELPEEMNTPNGTVIANDGTVWLADTYSSSLFSFDQQTEQFTQYVTADPMLSTYGNQTGIVKSPNSGPYWLKTDDKGRLVFNEQTGNNISMLDPASQNLIEYHVPSKNPYWSDCDPGTGMMLDNCGLAQIFDFTVDGNKIWFTEWVENNIGVVDTSVPLPVEIQLESNAIVLESGDSQHFNFIISSLSQEDIPDISVVKTTTHDFLKVELDHGSSDIFQLDSMESVPIHTTISTMEEATPGIYKILLGAQSPEVAVSKFVTVTIK